MALRLEVFQTDAPAATATVVTDTSALEEARLAAYEQGYAAGWDDAAAAAEDDRQKMSADLGRHLQTLGFTYHEAREHVLRALEPLLTEMTGRILPAIARAALGAVVVETLRPLAAQMALVPVRIALNPAARAGVEGVLATETALSLTIIEDPALPEAEARLTIGEAERHVSLDAATASIAAAVADFFALLPHPAPTEESADG
ncbi:MAG: flagellar biosynthesis protein [Paracoccaceae bacterium]|nr:MAG: flagellar biosynthesis protein [Paracoccaceae bacterium]